MFAYREIEGVISQEKNHTSICRVGGRNSQWGNLKAASGLHSYTDLILLYLQDTDTCSWGSTKAWQSSWLSSLFSQRWFCLDLHHISLLFSELYQNFLQYWRNIVKTMDMLSNSSQVQSPYQIPAHLECLPFPIPTDLLLMTLLSMPFSKHSFPKVISCFVGFQTLYLKLGFIKACIVQIPVQDNQNIL